MSKGLKFRAYIKHLKWITPVLSIDFKNEEVEVDISDGFGDMSFYRFDEVVLMQYAGLKDKNGREIYEGDIVRHATDEGIYKVVFENGGFHVENINEYDYQTIDEYPLEVIGNIYENPELLEVSE